MKRINTENSDMGRWNSNSMSIKSIQSFLRTLLVLILAIELNACTAEEVVLVSDTPEKQWNDVEADDVVEILTDELIEVPTQIPIQEPTQELTQEPDLISRDVKYSNDLGEELSNYYLNVRELSTESSWADQFKFGYQVAIEIPSEKNFALDVAYVTGTEYLEIRLKVIYIDQAGLKIDRWLPLVHLDFGLFDPEYQETLRNMGESENMIMDDLMEITKGLPFIVVNQSFIVDHIAIRPVKLSEIGGLSMTIEEFVELLGSKPRNVIVEGLFYITGELASLGEKAFQIGAEHSGAFDRLLTLEADDELPKELLVLPTASGFFIALLEN
jgi:hypothetical protein